MNGRIFAQFSLVILLVSQSEGLKRQKRIVGGKAAAKPPEDDPVVFVDRENYGGRIVGTRDPEKGFYVFRGIRFAEPPIGERRFQRPIPKPLEGEINATKWGPPCPQPSTDDPSKIIGNEDCLFLNVFTPNLPDSGDGYPVLIWIHGGGFRRGAACQYEMRNLIKKQMIVVSIQYRLGSLGFLSTGTKELPGNNAMFDMISAINWVKEYIEFFGGNPRNIIAFGHGSGASSAIMLSLSKFASNTFSGVIAMSGSILSNFAIDKNPLTTARYIAKDHSCPMDDIPKMVNCLRKLPVERLIQVDSKLENLKMSVQGFISGLSELLGPGPVVEGNDDARSLPNFITEKPEDSFEFGNFPSIPLLTGVVKDEIGGAILGKYKNEIQYKLKTIPNYLSKELIPNLQGTIAQFGNRTRQFVSNAFDKYLNFFRKNKNNKDIEKVVEVMGDSLFNAPTFLTIEHWSKKAKTFLYSFDHIGKRNCGHHFLSGLPIVDNKQSIDSTNHGDDLGYLFNPNNMNGEPIAANISEKDDTVRDIFTDIISQFARNGNLSITTVFENKWLQSIVPTFSEDSNSYISISSAPQLMKNFRFCEMGLWTGLTDRLKSSACSLFNPAIQVVDKVNTGVKQTLGLGNVESDQLSKSKPVDDLSNRKKGTQSETQATSEKNTNILSKVSTFSNIRFGK